jgi:hypothetical protein
MQIWKRTIQWLFYQSLVPWEIPIKIFFFETICSIRTKCWWNSHWMVLFQKCVWRFGPSTKMAPTAELSLSYVKLSTAVQPSWSEGGTTRHNFGRGPSNDYFIKVWFQLSNWFQTRSSKIVSGSRTLPPRWPPQCSCVVIESSFDLGERLQAPGSLLFSVSFQWWRTMVWFQLSNWFQTRRFYVNFP